METLWIGDFRARQIQAGKFHLVEVSEKTEEETENVTDTTTNENTTGDNTEEPTEEQQPESVTEHKYLIEGLADYTWFKDSAVEQLPIFAFNNCHVIIMLGFIDCVYSCTWQSKNKTKDDPYDIETIADNYIETINSIVEDYPGFIFYVCTIPPVLEDFPFAFYSDTGLIPKDILNSKIEQFNKKFTDAFKKKQQKTEEKKETEEVDEKDVTADPENEETSSITSQDVVVSSYAHFIDCHKYFTTTSFEMRDSLCLTNESCKHLYYYITSHCASGVAGGGGGAYISRPRTTKADAPRPGDESWENWTSPKNKCITIRGDVVLPNCTGYAWGRFMEVCGTTPTLPTSNAGDWYAEATDYERGQTPKTGAIICWSKSGHPGHVGFVEAVDTTNNTITTSESGYRNATYDPDQHFWVYTRSNSDGNWGLGRSGYHFEGFIYNPGTAPSSTGTLDSTTGTVQMPSGVSKANVISEDRYLSQSEMEINARYIWSYLGAKGWSLNAVAGMLGNMQHESTINPGRGEVGGSGFGLVQWTPYKGVNALIKWCNETGRDYKDIDAQLDRIIYEKDNGKQYDQNHYKYTFPEFSVSTDDPYTLACAFAFDYERSRVTLYGTSSEKEALRKKRGGSAEAWYQYLYAYAPGSTFTAKFAAENFKVDTVTPSSMSGSFIVSNAESAKYSIKKSKKTLISEELKFTSEKSEDEEETDEKTDETDKKTQEETETVKIITFKYDKLEPDTNYKLTIEVTSALGGEKREFETDFKTPQSFPDPVKNLKMLSLNTKLLAKELKVTFDTPADWGYWKNKSHGYEVHLIVNGKSIKTITKEHNKMDTKFIFIPDDLFSGYKSKIGDTLQVGIRTWVTNNKGNKIYDNDYITTSEAVCLLNQPFIAYLKTN